MLAKVQDRWEKNKNNTVSKDSFACDLKKRSLRISHYSIYNYILIARGQRSENQIQL